MDGHKKHKNILRNYVTPKRQSQNVSDDIMEKEYPATIAGNLLSF